MTFKIFNKQKKCYIERHFDELIEAIYHIEFLFNSGLLSWKEQRTSQIHRYENGEFDSIACE